MQTINECVVFSECKAFNGATGIKAAHALEFACDALASAGKGVRRGTGVRGDPYRFVPSGAVDPYASKGAKDAPETGTPLAVGSDKHAGVLITLPSGDVVRYLVGRKGEASRAFLLA